MKVLIAQARASARGGAEAYAQALAEVVGEMGHHVGTIDINGHVDPYGNHSQVSGLPSQFSLLNWAQVCRALPPISGSYDRVILAYGEGPKLGQPSLTIRHAPALFSHDRRLLAALTDHNGPMRQMYHLICQRIAGVLASRQETLTFANSVWTAKMIEEHTETTVHDILYPRVDTLPPRPCPRDPFGLISIGRIVPNKKLEDAVRVVTTLRENGKPATLTIIGRADTRYARDFVREVRDLTYVTVLANASRQDIADHCAKATFGLHMFGGEHFGIAVAEMISGGVIPLVHDSGGVCELVRPEALRFSFADNAVEKLTRLMDHPKDHPELRKNLMSGPAYRSAIHFPTQARSALRSFLQDEHRQYAA